jgi:chitinase
VFTYHDLRDGSRTRPFINTNGFTDFWDPAAQASYLYSPRDNVFITYASPRSVARKAQFVKDQRLRGLMCWSLDSDTPDHDLLRAMGDALKPGPRPSVDVGE